MALSGTINGTTNNPEILCRIDWTATQSVVDNSSTITAILRYWRTNEGYTTKGNYRGGITINGVEVLDSSSDIISFTYNSYTEVMRATITVPHNADGSKTVAISATGKINSTSLDTTYLSGSITLDRIERKALITAAPNFNDEGNPTITYSNPAGSAVTSLKACISLDGSADDIAYRDISKTGTSYTFNLTAAERDVLRAATTTSNSRTVRFYVQTVIGGITYLTYLSKTLTIVNAAPTLNPTAIDKDTVMLGLTGDKNKIVKYYSNIQYTTNAAALKKATIKSYKITCGNQSSTTASGYFYNTDNATVKFTITDSRGNTATKTINKTLINYVKLSCGLNIAAPTTDGKISFTITGNYFNGSFGTTNNTLTIQYRYNTNGGTYGSWVNVSPTISGTTYKGTVSLSGLNYLDSYSFEARAIDKIATVNSVIKTVKTSPVFDWGKNNFNVNGTFSVNNCTIIRRNEGYQNVVLSAEDAATGIFLRPNGTNSADGEVIIYTDGRVVAKGDLTANGYTLGKNNLLWSGGHLMTSSQTINLSQAVSEQKNGIVLVFSRYSNGAAENANFNSFFVPKYFVSAQGGTGSCFHMGTVNFSVMAAKYLYISDTSITGNDLNSSTGTGTSGIKYENNAYVLRYVIGV